MGFELYVFFLCFIVFSLLTVLLGGMLAVIIKLTVRLIRGGLEDEKIKTEYLQAKAKGRRMGCFDTIVSAILSLIFLAFFGFSLYVNLSQNTYFDNVPTLKVVNSASMSKKNEKNTYLFENGLDDQFNTFDMLFTYKLPKEDELKLYDIVVYEVDDILVVHRIVAIEERNSSHPNQRYFLCQGDAVESPDRFPVYYSQMRAIYKGERIPFVGSFVTFMQSPAGWLCVLLIIASLIGTPILEKRIYTEKRRRLIEIGFLNADGTMYEPSAFDRLRGRINSRSFEEALQGSDEEMRLRYERLVSYLSRFENIRVIESRTRRTYKCKNIPVARFAVRGKTVNANLALSPSEYTASKYIYDDMTRSSEYKLYPMRLKLSSERMTRWTLELLLDIANKNGIRILEEEKPIHRETDELTSSDEVAALSETVEETATSPFAHLEGRVNRRTFDESLASAGEPAQQRHARILALISRFVGLRVIEGRARRTYKVGSMPIVRLAVRGKTLNAYLALNPDEYTETKYIYENCSESSSYRLYPMRVRLSSERMTRWTLELLLEIANKNGITVADETAPDEAKEDLIEISFESSPISPFAHLEGRVNRRTFDESLALAGEPAQQRHARILALISRFIGLRVIEGRARRTYKVGSMPIVRLAVRGKTLNAYLALNPDEYTETKYIYENCSESNSYRLYPMRVRLSSERMTRWTLELLLEIANKNGITVADETAPDEAKEDLIEIPFESSPVSPFAHLEGREDKRNFAERLNDSPLDTQSRYNSISGLLESIKGIRVIESKRTRTYKVGAVPIVRLAVRGKTLNAYLALDPSRFAGTKYIFTDMSGTKKFALYPMRVRVSSERQKRRVLELIGFVINENNLETGGEVQ